jgi:hypothetical protein
MINLELKNIKEKIIISKNNALKFCDLLKENQGYKYTLNHDTDKYPSAILYGTWSVAFIKKLLLKDNWTDQIEKNNILDTLNSNRLKNGLFYPKSLNFSSHSKSKEYLQLHCYNYSVGAALEIDKTYDFQSKYMDSFLDFDFLNRWLEQRSLQRPWEESNNIVNVASYLATCNDNGHPKAKECLMLMYNWHNSFQNPNTGGFEIFNLTRKNILQSMAGAVHNFHIHKYLNKPLNYEEIIANNVIPFLYEGPLSACLSIDFVELACSTINYLEDTYELEQALLYHLNQLLLYQNDDGGWYENPTPTPTIANGMKEIKASSNSYSTWFRLCSIAMISITLLDDSNEDWAFRNTLGMGYSNGLNKVIPKQYKIDKRVFFKYYKKNLPSNLQEKLIRTAVKILR